MFDSDFREFDRRPHPFDRHSRLFKKGDMKYVILDLVREKPSHGYEVTQALEDRFYGMYSPSAGSVYPILQLLEDMGYVTSDVADGKRVYTITESGRKFLEDKQKTMETIRGRFSGLWGPEHRKRVEEVRVAGNYARELNHAIRHIALRRDPAKIARVNKILSKTLREIDQIYQER